MFVVFWNFFGLVWTRLHLWQADEQNVYKLNESEWTKVEFTQIWELSRTRVFLVLACVCSGAVANTTSVWVHRWWWNVFEVLKNIKQLGVNALRVSSLSSRTVRNSTQVNLLFLYSFSNDIPVDFFILREHRNHTKEHNSRGNILSWPKNWKVKWNPAIKGWLL